jgi:Uma2 family endonuclease
VLPGSSASVPSSTGVVVRYRVREFDERWIIYEDPVPEAAWHDACLELLKALLVNWSRSLDRHVAIYRDIAIRMRRETPAVGFNPDLCVIDPAPPDAERLDSIRLWEPGHLIPTLAIEVVSRNHPYKDYVEIPDKCAAAGVTELIVFDPMLAGPRQHGGPFRLQIWRRTADGGFERAYACDGPARSEILGAFCVVTSSGERLRIAHDSAGDRLWLTPEEQERAAKEAERAAREAERDAALTRIAELEAELKK